MDNAEVRERLQGALLGPGKVAVLDIYEADEFRDVREHLAGCSACRAESEALRRTALLLALAVPDELRAPAEARQRILAAVAGTGVPRGAAGRATTGTATTAGAAEGMRAPGSAGASSPSLLDRLRARRGVLIELSAAAVVLVVAGGLVGIALSGQRSADQEQARELAHVTAEVDELLRQPDTTTVTLRTPEGVPGGTLLFDPKAHAVVVISTTLEEDDSARYRCFIERDAQRIPVGWMHYASEVSYWAGPMEEPGDAGRPGDRFLVVLEGEEEPALAGAF